MADFSSNLVHGMVDRFLRDIGGVARNMGDNPRFSPPLPSSSPADDADFSEEEKRIRAFTQQIEREFNRLTNRMQAQWITHIDKELREGLAHAVRQNLQRLGQDIRSRNRERLEQLALDSITGSLGDSARTRFGTSTGQIFANMLRSLSTAGRRNL